jgi:GAF domain-containing protein/type II secretion system (T2SS) protein E
MLGEQLVGAGLLHPDKLAEAKLHQELTGKDLVEAVLTLGLVPERDLLRVLAQHHQLQYLTTEKISQLKVGDDVLDQVNVRVAESLAVMPIRRNPDGTLWVLGGGPLPEDGVERLKTECGAKKVNVILARPASIRAAVRRHYYRDLDAFTTMNEGALDGEEPMHTQPEMAAVVTDERTQAPTDPRENTDPHLALVPAITSVTTVVPPAATKRDVSGPHTIVEGPTDPQQGAARAQGLGEAEVEITRKVKLAISDVQAVLERENQRLRVSLSLSSVMGQLHKLEDVVRELLVALLDLLPADGAALALLGEQGKPILVETLRRDTGGAFQVSGSLLAAALVARVPVVSGNVAADPKWQGETTLIARGVRSVMISALRSRDGRPSGALYTEARDQNAFGPDASEQLRMVAQVAGAAIDHVNLVLRLEAQSRLRAQHERFLSGPRAVSAAAGAPPFDLRPRALDGTFLVVRPVPPLRPRSNESLAQLFQRMEAHLDVVCARIHAHGGLVESISRGEVGALFGGPESHDQHLENALTTAQDLCALTASDGRTLPCAMGVASGSMVAGGAGRGGLLQYAVLGEPVDLARALAATAASLEIHASEAVEQAAAGFHAWEPSKAGVAVGGELRPAFKLVWR